MNSEKKNQEICSSYTVSEGYRRVETSGLTVRCSLPLVLLPTGRPFIGVRFVIALEFFDLCTFSIPFFLSPPISAGGSMVSMPMVGVIAFRV